MTDRRRPISSLRNFVQSEASGGILLMLAALLAILVANSPLADTYFRGLQAHVGPLSVLHWINDALMALFFLLVGLEIKREFVAGHLSVRGSRALPMIAAAGGMAMPALVYLAVTMGTPGLGRGWAIPAATDIAFAIGVMAILGRRAPTSLKLFLTTVAIVDDMGAVAIIALFYTDTLNGLALGGALVVMAAMFGLGRIGVRRLWAYLVLAALLWLLVLLSGVHATVAGVLAAICIPMRPAPGAVTSAPSPLYRLEHGLQPWVVYLIVPVFGFANAGVSFAGFQPGHLLAPLPLGIAAGLFFGKQAGILAAIWLCDRLGISQRPGGATWGQLYGMCLLCGIGFTMSLFIGGLAFTDPLLMEEVKIGVLGGSLLSAVAGYAVLRAAGNKGRDRQPA